MVSLKSKTKALAMQAGHSLPLVPWKVSTSANMVNFYLSPNSNSSTAAPITTDAMVATSPSLLGTTRPMLPLKKSGIPTFPQETVKLAVAKIIKSLTVASKLMASGS